MKRIISLVAVVAMVFSLCALNVSAKNEHIFVCQEYTYEDTVVPGGQIVFNINDVVTTDQDGWVAYACINGSLSYDSANLTFVSAEGYDESKIQFWRLKNDLEYSEIGFDHAYLTPIYQDAGEVIWMNYTITFDVPEDAAIGTTYDFQLYYGGDAGNLFADEALTNIIDNCITNFDGENGGTPGPVMTVTVVEAAEEEPAVAPAAARDEVRQGCDACGVAAGIRFISSIDTAAAGDGLLGYGISITYNNVTKDVPAKNIFETEGDVVYFTAVVTNAPKDATFVAQPYAEYADGRVYATASANA